MVLYAEGLSYTIYVQFKDQNIYNRWKTAWSCRAGCWFSVGVQQLLLIMIRCTLSWVFVVKRECRCHQVHEDSVTDGLMSMKMWRMTFAVTTSQPQLNYCGRPKCLAPSPKHQMREYLSEEWCSSHRWSSQACRINAECSCGSWWLNTLLRWLYLKFFL